MGSFIALTKKSEVTNIKDPVLNTLTKYSIIDIQKHNNPSDCWTAINDKVYNLTEWINKHPGGAKEIISLCGIDGSLGYNAQHGGKRKPANELANFLIGDLVK